MSVSSCGWVRCADDTSSNASAALLQVYQLACQDWRVNAAGLGAGLSPPPSMAPAPMSDALAAMQLTAPRLESAAAISRFGVSSDEHRRRDRLIAEWEEWARGYPESMKPTLRWCGPEEVLAFLETWRLTHHGRRPAGAPALPAGQQVPIAPPTLKGVQSRLSTIFQRLGRHGPWSEGRRDGNPAAHATVLDYLKGYDRYAFEHLEYESSGAVPLSLEKYWQLIEYLTDQAGAEDCPYRACMLLRDATAFAALWECGQRVKEVGHLVVSDFCYQNTQCTAAWEDICSETVDPDIPVLLESSHGTKTAMERHPGAYEIRKDVSEDGCGVLLALLPEYANAMVALGTALTHWLLRPGSQPEKGWFEQRPLSTSAIDKRLKAHLQAMRCWEGESSYSFRRGSAQDLRASGVSDKSIMRLRQWRTEKTLRRYLHTTRHRLRLRPLPNDERPGHEDGGAAKRQRGSDNLRVRQRGEDTHAMETGR